MSEDPKDNKLTQPTGTGIKVSQVQKKFQPLWAKQKDAAIAKEKREAEANLTGAIQENRIVLMLDISGSMGEPASYRTSSRTKIEYLHDAYTKFIEGVDFVNTSIGVETFPYEADDYYGSRACGLRQPLTTDVALLLAGTTFLDPTGGTPMHRALNHVHNSYGLTRGVLISDGDADSSHAALQEAESYRESKVPIDCIHIGNSTSGEDLLKKIAEMTGGIYLKFVDVEAFSKALTYLTPRHRAMLTSGAVSAAQIGATEVKYLGK